MEGAFGKGVFFAFLILRLLPTLAQHYEVADIDCGVGNGGKELISARLRRPDGFRGTPIFADDRGSNSAVNQDISKDQQQACQIFHEPTDPTGHVFVLRVLDFSQCGVLKRNGFIHVRVWFPQLPGVVMLSDQEVIIMCKPKQPTVTQSKAAGFAGSIPTGARFSGVVEESPGSLEYEVALFRESGTSGQGRSTGAYITGADSQELPVDQAVPIGTRLQLRAKINQESSWQHAKLMEVSVSPDPKDGNADGSVALIKNGCRNPDLVSIIPKQPYRLKERTNEVVLDFEAFLLSNMGERNTLWLHTQIKACMESQDCRAEFCVDVHQPSGFGRRRRDVGPTTMTSMVTSSNGTAAEYSAPLSQHWRTVQGPNAENISDDSDSGNNSPSAFPLNSVNVPSKSVQNTGKPVSAKQESTASKKFGDNIGFSVVMPAEYYRNAAVVAPPFECRGWAAATLFSLLAAVIAGALTCFLSQKLRRHSGRKEKALSYIHSPIQTTKFDAAVVMDQAMNKARGKHHHQSTGGKYARDSSLYRS